MNNVLRINHLHDFNLIQQIIYRVLVLRLSDFLFINTFDSVFIIIILVKNMINNPIRSISDFFQYFIVTNKFVAFSKCYSRVFAIFKHLLNYFSLGSIYVM